MDEIQEQRYDDLHGVAIYYMGEGIGSRPVTTYGDRLERLGLDEDDTGALESYRRFRAGDVRIDIQATDPVTEYDRAVIMSAPLETDVDDVLPDDVYKDLKQKAVGVRPSGNLDGYFVAPERSWDLQL